MLPKEHGAYGQLAFPLVTAMLVARPTVAALCWMLAVCAGFLAHEPALVLLGARGPRAAREEGRRARTWLACAAVAGGTAAAVALAQLPPVARALVVVPAVPAALLAGLAVAGREKTGAGEVSASLAFATAAMPAAVASGVPVPGAGAIALSYAALFTVSTLAVRVVVLRVRGGGDPAGVARTRALLLAVAAAATAAALFGAARGAVSAGTPAAVVPGVVVALGVALRPPPPAALRRVGWALVATSAATMAALVAVVRLGSS